MGIRKHKTCAECGDKHAIFWSWKKNRMRADKNHDLCFRCMRALKDAASSEQYYQRYLQLVAV